MADVEVVIVSLEVGETDIIVEEVTFPVDAAPPYDADVGPVVNGVTTGWLVSIACGPATLSAGLIASAELAVTAEVEIKVADEEATAATLEFELRAPSSVPTQAKLI